MKRPKWAKEKRWKLVNGPYFNDGGFYTSPIYVNARTSDCDGRSRGEIISYRPGEVVKSPNGVCRKQRHECCRGIHAYSSRKEAKANRYPNNVIIPVYAVRWHGSGKKCRASRVWVGK